MALALLEWSSRRYLAAVHRHPMGVAVEACIAWACAWTLCHGRTR